MADTFPIWQRQVMPEGRLVAPQGGLSVAAAFGAGLQQLSQGVSDVARAKATVQQKNDAAWSAVQKPQAEIEIGKQYDALEQNAESGAPGHVAATEKIIDDYAADLLRQAPDNATRVDLQAFMGSLRAQYLGQASQFAAKSQIAQRVANIDSAGDLWGNNLVNHPERFDAAREEMEKTIRAQGLAPDRAAEEIKRSTQNLATFAMNGQASADPKQFLKDAQAGKWNAFADPARLAEAEVRAIDQMKVDDARAQQDAREAAAAAQASLSIAYRDAVSTAAATGNQNLISEDQIRKTWGGTPAGNKAAERMIRDLRAATTQGQLGPTIASASPADLDAMEKKLSPEGKSAFTEGDALTYRLFTELRNKKDAAYRGSDPGGAALAYSLNVQKSWSAWQADPTNKDALRSAIVLTQQEQTRQGVTIQRTQPMPQAVATAVVGQIMSRQNTKLQLQALIQFADLGDPAVSRQVLGQLTTINGGLPAGTALVLDTADPLGDGKSGDTAKAERMLAALQAETKGIELPQQAMDAIATGLNNGLVGVLAQQASLTGNAGAAASLAGTVRDAVEQGTKAKILLGGEPTKSARDAISDFTGQYATINDPALAAIYYSKVVEDQAPHAIEMGLAALRRDAASALLPKQRPGAPGTKEPPNPYVLAAARDVERGAVWVNSGAGFALVLPGASRAMKYATLAEVEARGLKELKAGPQTPASPLPDYGPATFVPIAPTPPGAQP